MLASAVGFLLSDGELQRIKWIRAMRRCLLRMNSMICYEHPSLTELLRNIDLRSTLQERSLTRILHTCAAQIEKSGRPEIIDIFISESTRLSGYASLGTEDRSAFEGLLDELGRTRLVEQLELIQRADGQLRMREEMLNLESEKRARLIRMLGFCSGAAMFLILI